MLLQIFELEILKIDRMRYLPVPTTDDTDFFWICTCHSVRRDGW